MHAGSCMTEYWQSQARKFCEFCKCWFADNKVSISFHENGKRHKENVQKHISQLTKKSAKEAKQQGKIDDDMKKMEAAAMAAYLKDVQNNADLTSQSINEMLNQSGSSVSNTPITTANSTTNSSTKSPPKKATPVWQEAKGDDGSSYYWNTDTNETTWDPPDDYVSLAQQEKQQLKDNTEEKKKQKLKKQKQKDAFKEANAYIAREQMRELAVKDTPPPTTSGPTFGPAPRSSKPYGTWTAVLNEPAESIDLQLPKPDKEAPPPPVVMEPEVIQFRERRVESLGDGPVEFKRRKFNNARRNMRQKTDGE